MGESKGGALWGSRAPPLLFLGPFAKVVRYG